MSHDEDKPKKKAKGPKYASRTKYEAIASARIEANKTKNKKRHALRVERQTFKVINVARGSVRAKRRLLDPKVQARKTALVIEILQQ